jgi:predicted TIM-barrel fold metal-dependent hydrolase
MPSAFPSDLPLSRYRPRARLVLPEHRVDAARFPAIDAHSHLGRWLSSWAGREGQWLVEDVESWLEAMSAFNVHGFVNLDGRWGDELRCNLARFDERFPGRIATFCHVDWALLSAPRAPETLAAHLAGSAAAGAAGVKVWKDLGLQVRDAKDRLVLPDDERLGPLWETAGDADIPVWWHVADPVAFFDPVDEQNEYLELLASRPDWSFAGPEFPSFERLIDSLEAVVAAHPRTTFVAVHAGCHAENLGWVGRMLDSYPNFHIDIAARIAQLGRQPRATRELILRHPDRVLFGCDEIPHTGESYPTHFRFLETADEHFAHSAEDPPLMGRWAISGLDLPDDVLRRVYSGNAARLVPQLNTPSTPGSEDA